VVLRKQKDLNRNSKRPQEGFQLELEEAKGGGGGEFLYIAGMDGNLVVSPDQIDPGEEAITRELVGVIKYVTGGIVVENGLGVQHFSLREDANRCPSWKRYEYVEQRTRNFQSGQLCRRATWRRTPLWRWRANPVPVVVVGR
jgi:hypothetical protein